MFNDLETTTTHAAPAAGLGVCVGWAGCVMAGLAVAFNMA